jgi:cyclophilin family peptidyl-prolyl cis-trans isomerase
MKPFLKLSWMLALCTPFCLLQAQIKKKPAKKVPIRATKNSFPVAKTTVADTLKITAAVRIKISTSMGEIVVKLSDKTPLHRDNFVKLVNSHFYDSLLFHRIIAGFMIQGGDPTSKNAEPGILLGNGAAGYTIPAEFDSTLYHKKGALAAARDNNPQKASSGCQFYIVQGRKYSNSELDVIEMQKGVYFSPAKRMTYTMNGGTPNLDMNYTVFGEVESGIEVVDEIAQSAKDGNNRPLTNISMKMEVIKEDGK